jgi:hypothetical protein
MKIFGFDFGDGMIGVDFICNIEVVLIELVEGSNEQG